MNVSRGIRVAAGIFLVLALFWTPKQYARVENKTVQWTETLPTPFWRAATSKYSVYEIPGGSVIVSQETLAEFKSSFMSRGVEPKRLPFKVRVTDRYYVFTGLDWSLLLGYLAVALAVGAGVALCPICDTVCCRTGRLPWRGYWNTVCGWVGLRRGARKPPAAGTPPGQEPPHV